MRITTFDEGGYLSGQRIRLRGSKDLFFDEATYTNAFIGDLKTMTLVNHESTSKNLNYRHAVAQKQLKQMLAYGVEYTWQAGTQTIREDVVVDVRRIKAVNSVRIEGDECPPLLVLQNPQISPVLPLEVDEARGFAITAQEGTGRLSGAVEYAPVDRDYSVYTNGRFVHAVDFTLNADTCG